MKSIFAFLALALTVTFAADTVYEFTVKDLDGNDVSLDKYRGNVLVIVNVASNCGLASSNYPQLNELYTRYKDQGLRILAFPSNQFYQEPGTPEEIKEFLNKHDVQFDVFGKIMVNGKDADPLYTFLKDKQSGFMGKILGNSISWNFTKFLVDKNGIPVKRYAPTTSPNSMEDDIKKLLE